jgi:hypothetical protein
MTTEHQTTQEEEAYSRLLDEKWEMLSEAGHTVLGEAHSAAYRAEMVSSCSFQPEEYEEAMEQMRRAAAELTDRECALLATLWRAALAAASSLDPYDFETFAGFRVYQGDLYRYYRMFSGMIEEVVWEKKLVDFRKEMAEEELIDQSDVPF